MQTQTSYIIYICRIQDVYVYKRLKIYIYLLVDVGRVAIAGPYAEIGRTLSVLRVQCSLRHSCIHLPFCAFYSLFHFSKTTSSKRINFFANQRIFMRILVFPSPLPDSILQNSHKIWGMERQLLFTYQQNILQHYIQQTVR